MTLGKHIHVHICMLWTYIHKYVCTFLFIPFKNGQAKGSVADSTRCIYSCLDHLPRRLSLVWMFI